MSTPGRIIIVLFFLLFRLGIVLFDVRRSRKAAQQSLLMLSLFTPVLLYSISAVTWMLLPKSLFFSSSLGYYAILAFEMLHTHMLLFCYLLLHNMAKRSILSRFPLVFIGLLLLAFLLPVLLNSTYVNPSRSGSDKLKFMLLIAGIIALFVLIYLFLSSSITESMLTESLSSSKQEIDAKRADEIEKMYNNTRKMRHEIGDQLAIVERLLHEGNTEAGELYLRKIKEEFHPLLHTGCAPLDAQIALKDTEIRAHGFEFHYELCPLNGIVLTDRELCSLTSNLLDNALEACIEERFKDAVIDFRILRVKDMLFIQCINPTRKKAAEISNGKIRTSKDPNIHGFGIPIMQEIVRKHHGLFDLRIENGHFNVMISIPQSA